MFCNSPKRAPLFLQNRHLPIGGILYGFVYDILCYRLNMGIREEDIDLVSVFVANRNDGLGGILYLSVFFPIKEEPIVFIWGLDALQKFRVTEILHKSIGL